MNIPHDIDTVRLDTLRRLLHSGLALMLLALLLALASFAAHAERIKELAAVRACARIS